MTSFKETSENYGQQTNDSQCFTQTNILSNFKKYIFDPSKFRCEKDKLPVELHKWATQNKVQHFSYLSFPYNNTLCQKHQSFIDIKYSYQQKLQGQTQSCFDLNIFQKGQGDGSSFPSGGIRATHRARAYMVRDPQSQIVIRPNHKIMYIPAMLVSHNGQALDDKGLYKKAQRIMKLNGLALLQALGQKPKDLYLALGLEQEFFVIPKKDYLKREDIRSTGRALLGNLSAKNQKMSDHYYGKIPSQIQSILKQVQKQFLQIGIPLKTKHNEVANNQFEYSAIYCEAGKAIDQNLIAMQILKQQFDRHGYTVLLHEKPFKHLNGSGKHANWSLNFVNQNNKIVNVFAVPKAHQDPSLFRLFVLLTLSALKKNNSLFMASVAPTGNEIRLGGHQAPPRIISAYLGSTVSAIVDGIARPSRKNLKENMPFLQHDLLQEDTDRNRTSPFAYTGSKFQFRALGSSQNPAFPMSVIAATLADQFKIATQRLQKGQGLNDIINSLLRQTESVRFDGNGYSKQWPKQAEQRGLYVNKIFTEVYSKIFNDIKVFEIIGACTADELKGKCNVLTQNYMKTVQIQSQALLNIAYKKIVPSAVRYLSSFNLKQSTYPHIENYTKKINTCFSQTLAACQQLETISKVVNSIEESSKLRQKIQFCSEKLTNLLHYLPKDLDFPDNQDILLL